MALIDEVGDEFRAAVGDQERWGPAQRMGRLIGPDFEDRPSHSR
ncbi:MAG: hypothetical protein QOK39_1416 [Acidimicrobiaceae bacterium]|jgi:hypothetical protein|nr:hypothetical protein [Acidimicrobiaceae bacterium]